jgi:hypothetical protein
MIGVARTEEAASKPAAVVHGGIPSVTCIALALLTSLLSADAHAQSADARWPERPIRLIVPFTAGSSSDIVARLVAQKLAERLGQPLVVENRVGGGGSIGSGEVARADADGYTLGLANTSTHAVAASVAPLSYDPVNDFTPVSMLGHSPFVLALHPGVPAQSVQELIAVARAKPRMLNYASAGPATLAHLSGALFEKMAKIELTHVPYRGNAVNAILTEYMLKAQRFRVGRSAQRPNGVRNRIQGCRQSRSRISLSARPEASHGRPRRFQRGTCGPWRRSRGVRQPPRAQARRKRAH